MVEAAGTFELAGELTVNRLGFGAMRITGEGVWGEPPDREVAKRVLRRAVELGVDFVDTADSYGPEVSENLIAEELHPYEGITIATKGGFERSGPGKWHINGRPEHLRSACEASLRRLNAERIDLYQLHRRDPKVPFEESLGTLTELRQEGKIRLIGLSEVSVEDLETALEVTPVATVQNRYNVVDRASEDVLDECERRGIGFMPWFPLATGKLAQPGGPLDDAARRHDAAPSQIALAWLLARSPVMLPIPGTGSVEHLEENCAAAPIELDADEVERIGGAAG
ncbi:MAG TPA: aldo/keto reductase [Thermoleophilaceae bacterium]